MVSHTDARTKPEHHRRRPPADHRFLGIDTRVFPHALVILAVWLLWTVALPAVDSALPQDDPVMPGDLLSVTESVTMRPATDWNVASGFRIDQRGADDSVPNIELTRGNITFTTRADTFDGTPDELLTQVDAVSAATGGGSVLELSGSPTPFVTNTGLTGAQVDFATPSIAGSITALIVDGTGIEVQVSGPPEQITDRAPEITTMIASISAENREAQ